MSNRKRSLAVAILLEYGFSRASRVHKAALILLEMGDWKIPDLYDYCQQAYGLESFTE
jgi:hypothetical protein